MESKNFDIRKHVLQYDDVMNQQREVIYGQRREVLEGADMHSKIMEMRDSLIDEALARHLGDDAEAAHWDLNGLSEYLEKLCMDRGGVRVVYEGLSEKTKAALREALIARCARRCGRKRIWICANLNAWRCLVR